MKSTRKITTTKQKRVLFTVEESDRESEEKGQVEGSSTTSMQVPLYLLDNHILTKSSTKILNGLYSQPQPKAPRTILQPRKIYQTQNEMNFNIDITLQTCVNGYLSWTRTQPASLLVFNVQLVCVGKKGSFSHVMIRADFEDIPGTQRASPVILAHAPFEFEEKQKKTKLTISRSNKVQSEVSVPLGGNGKLKQMAVKEVTSTGSVDYFGKGCSGTVASSEGRISGIWWNVKKSSDPNVKDDAGIDSNYRFAVLLTRKSRSPFLIRIKMDVEVANMGMRYKMKGGASKFLVGGDSLSLIANPKTYYEGDCAGFSRYNLGRLRQRQEMANLTSVVR